MVIVDEGQATEELIYSTGKSGATLTTPLANRGIEGGTAQAHAVSSTVKGILSAGMWNDLIDSLLNVLVQATGAVDTTKIVTLTASQTLTNKTLTTPTITTPNLTTPTITDGDLKLPTDGNIQVNAADPKRAFYIPANGMFGGTTLPAAAGQGESATHLVNYKTLDFDTSQDEFAYFNVPAPLNWDLGTVTAQFFWTSAGATPGQTVTWGIRGLALSNDDPLVSDYGTAVTVADTLIAQGDVHVTAATSAITLAGTPAANDMLFFRIYRDVSEDNISDDARLIGVRIEYGVSKYSDVA